MTSYKVGVGSNFVTDVDNEKGIKALKKGKGGVVTLCRVPRLLILLLSTFSGCSELVLFGCTRMHFITL